MTFSTVITEYPTTCPAVVLREGGREGGREKGGKREGER